MTIHDLENIYFSSKQEYATKLLEVYKIFLSYNIPLPRYSPLLYTNCTFDSINTFLISPDLKIYQCSAAENIFDFEVGYIDEYGVMKLSTTYFRKFVKDIFKKEKCINCKMIPLCYGGCSYLEGNKQNECIPEKYIFNDIIKLYGIEFRRG